MDLIQWILGISNFLSNSLGVRFFAWVAPLCVAVAFSKPSTVFIILRWTFSYGRYPEIAQKDIEGGNVRCRNMDVILRWLKIRDVKFLFNFCSKYWSRVQSPSKHTFFSSKILRWLKIRSIQYFVFALSLILRHLKITCIFRHLTLAPSMSFWDISGFLPYIKLKAYIWFHSNLRNLNPRNFQF